MLPYAPVPDVSAARRPQVTDRGQDDASRWFTLVFEPGQRFPDHRNAAAITLRTVRGSGMLERARQRVELFPGHVVALHPSELHGVTAGAEGLELRITLPLAASCAVPVTGALPDTPSCELPAASAGGTPAPSSCTLPAAPSCECC